MKIKLAVIALCLANIFAIAQTATDFTSTDCSGNSHNLFSELNSGKVIVLCWVMPCGVCTGPALTTKNVVESYTSTNPDKVFMYLCDDYANTTCTSLNTWKNNIGLPNVTSFSDASINMSDYGSTGMPKIVVIGGGNHTVFYNADDAVNASDLQVAINAALSVAGISEQNKLAASLSVSPNPSAEKALIKFNLSEGSEIQVQLFNLRGQLVQNIFTGKLPSGKQEIELDVRQLSAGMYLVKAGSGSQNNYVNMLVAR